MSSPFEVARDRMQIYNAARNVDKPNLQNTRKSKTADFGKLNILLLKGNFGERYSLQIKSRERLFATMRICCKRYTHGLNKIILSGRKSKGSFRSRYDL